MTYFITGAAGFIGYFLSKELLNNSQTVIALDSLNEEYSPILKQERVKELQKNKNFHFFCGNIEDISIIEYIFLNYKIDILIHLATQIKHDINTQSQKIYNSCPIGILNLLEACRKADIRHFLFASSASLYGSNTKTPSKENDLYNLTINQHTLAKRANELIAYSYSHLYHVPSTALRFFHVYGPLGRPDMAYFKFADKILKNERIQLFNNGKLYRNYTYIDDVIDAIIKLIPLPPCKSKEESTTQNNAFEMNPYFDVFNIGNEKPILINDLITILEEKLKKKAIKQFMSVQKINTYPINASIEKLHNKTGWKPLTSLEEGIGKFAKWFLKTNNKLSI